jgi:ribosomal protein S8E
MGTELKKGDVVWLNSNTSLKMVVIKVGGTNDLSTFSYLNTLTQTIVEVNLPQECVTKTAN